MKQSQKFVASKSGVIQGGNLSYVIDTDVKIIVTSGEIDAGTTIFGHFVGKKFPLNSQATIDPEMIKSANLKAGGQEMPFGPLVLSVRADNSGIADVAFQQGDNRLSGTALLDFSGEIVKIKRVDLVGTEMHVDLDLHLVEVE